MTSQPVNHSSSRPGPFRVNPYDSEMLSVEEALDRITSQFTVLDAEERSLLEAAGHAVAEEIRSGLDVPPLPNSAMDGYAVRADDSRAASRESPVELPVIATVAAGEMPRGRVAPGTAMRIMTGAPVPEGADAVIPFEDTDELERSAGEGNVIGLRAEVGGGANIRRAGEDIRRGSLVISAGSVLGPAEIGLLASIGLRRVRVIRRPVVAVVSTGDELLAPGEPPQASKIYDSNAYTLAALVQGCGGMPKMAGTALDNAESLNAVLDEAVDADMVITSAGVSKGDYDMVKHVLAARGRVALSLVRMRPAKPLAFGALRGPGGREVPHLGLPGNPASAMVAFELFAAPVIRLMMGLSPSERPTLQATLDDPIDNPDGRRVFARVVVYQAKGADGYRAKIAGSQGSGVLTTMARANGLAVCPEDVRALGPGDTATVLPLRWKDETV